MFVVDGQANAYLKRFPQCVLSARPTVAGVKWQRFGCYGNNAGQFYRPRAVALVEEMDWVFVADERRVQVFDVEGNYLRHFGSEGRAIGQFQRINGIAVNHSKRLVFVSDGHNNRVQVFDFEGAFRYAFGSKGNSEGKFREPGGIAIDSRSGEVFVSEYHNNRVQVFSEDGTFLRKFGSRGQGLGEFWGPTGLCVDEDRNRLLIADRNNHRLLELNLRMSSNGQFYPLHYVSEFGSRVELPCGVVIAKSTGEIFVSDEKNHCLLVFSADGVHKRSFGSSGRGNKHFSGPFGIAVHSSMLHLFVTDQHNNRVHSIML